MILAVLELFGSGTQRPPLLLRLLKDLLDVGGVLLEQLLVFGFLLGRNYWQCMRLWTEVPLDLGVLELVFYLINVDLSICALVWAYVHDSYRSL